MSPPLGSSISTPPDKAIDLSHGGLVNSEAGPSAPSGVSSPFSSFEDRSGETQQRATKLAGRLNASAVSERERDDLLAEREVLIDKELAGTITKPEEIRLKYVRWSLDRIEDARNGLELDKLELQVNRLEELGDYLKHLEEQLTKAASRRR